MTAHARSYTETELVAYLRKFAKAYSRRDVEAVMTMIDPDRPLFVLGSGLGEKRLTFGGLNKGVHRDLTHVPVKTEAAAMFALLQVPA